MTGQARKLRRVQYRAQLDLDRRFAPLATEVEALILRHALDGKITPLTKALVMPVLERMLAETEPGVAGVIVARSAEAERVAGEAFSDG